MAADRSSADLSRSPFGAEGPSLGFLLAAAGFATAYRFREALRPADLQPREFAVLRQVAAEQGTSQQACGAALHVAPSRMVALVDELERKGFLERRANPEDRRARALHVTPAGRCALTAAFAAAARLDAEIFGGLTAAEAGELRRLLGLVSGAMGLEPGTHPGMTHD